MDYCIIDVATRVPPEGLNMTFKSSGPVRKGELLEFVTEGHSTILRCIVVEVRHTIIRSSNEPGATFQENSLPTIFVQKC